MASHVDNGQDTWPSWIFPPEGQRIRIRVARESRCLRGAGRRQLAGRAVMGYCNHKVLQL